MAEINLLPTEFKSSKEVVRASRTLSRVIIGMTIVLMVVGMVGGGYVYYLSGQAKSAVDRQNDLTRTVNNLQSSEQKLYLIKDRISKLTSVFAARDKYTLIGKYDSLISANASTLEEIEISESNPKLSVAAADSQNLQSFLDTISSSGDFSTAFIESIEYRESLGYIVNMQLE